MHHTVRTYDVTTLFFQVCVQNISIDMIDRRFVPDNISVHPIFHKALFWSILLRMTGRVQPFHDWHQLRLTEGVLLHDGPPPPVSLPSSQSDVSSFLNFLALTCMDPKGIPHSTTSWTSNQFASSIPRHCRHATTLASFVRFLFDALPATIKDLLVIASQAASNSSSDPSQISATLPEDNTRERARLLIQQLMNKPLPTDDRKGTEFISRQVVLDLEEVWDLLFGPPTVVHPGYGGMQGFRLLAAGSNGDHLSPTALFKSMVTVLQSNWSNSELALLGLRRGVTSPNVFVTLNGRPFTIEDAEHFACSALYHAVACTLPNRHCCVPSPASPHCHPIPLFGRTGFFGPLGHSLLQIAVQSVDAWQAYTPGNDSLDNVFFLREEDAINASLNALSELRCNQNACSLYAIVDGSGDVFDDDSEDSYAPINLFAAGSGHSHSQSCSGSDTDSEYLPEAVASRRGKGRVRPPEQGPSSTGLILRSQRRKIVL
jgi:hypothetical protein